MGTICLNIRFQGPRWLLSYGGYSLKLQKLFCYDTYKHVKKNEARVSCNRGKRKLRLNFENTVTLSNEVLPKGIYEEVVGNDRGERGMQ